MDKILLSESNRKNKRSKALDALCSDLSQLRKFALLQAYLRAQQRDWAFKARELTIEKI